MSDAVTKVDPDFYNRRLLDTETNGDQSRRVSRDGREGNGFAGGFGGGGGRGSGGGGVRRTNGFGGTELHDYLLRQHSLLGLYLSLRPRDEAEAERNWGFPHPQRLVIAGVTIVVPLFLALVFTGSWLWKAILISGFMVAAKRGTRFALRTSHDLETSVQGYTVSMWPHMIVGTLGLLALVWFVWAAASGTGWRTMRIAFTSLLFIALAEVTLRAYMWHFKWMAPAERFAFLKPWGGYMPVNTAPRATSYAPPRPTPVPPSVPLGGGGGAINDGDYDITPSGEERMALSDEIGKAIGEDDIQSESV